MICGPIKTAEDDMSSKLEQVKLQLEMAAKGCVSGTLAEWPLLRDAFAFCGWFARGQMGPRGMKDLAQRCLDKYFNR